MPTVLSRPNRFGGRQLGTLTTTGLNRSPNYPLGFGAKPALTDVPVTDAVSTYTPRPRPAALPVARVNPFERDARAALAEYDPASVGMRNAAANFGIYEPGSFGEQNAIANNTAYRGPTGYRAPQQTERANPLTGDNDYPMESTTTTVARAPFSMRGSRVPPGGNFNRPPLVGHTPPTAYQRFAKSIYGQG
jgi:hypothetical protein